MHFKILVIVKNNEVPDKKGAKNKTAISKVFNKISESSV